MKERMEFIVFFFVAPTGLADTLQGLVYGVTFGLGMIFD